LVTFYNEDFLTSDLPMSSIDLIVTSPPYNLGLDYKQFTGDSKKYADYLDFFRSWLTLSYHILKDDGRLCLNIPLDTNKYGKRSVGADVTCIAQDCGFSYHTTIIWNESNMSRRTAWGSWMSASAPYVIAPVELIVVLYKHQWKKISGSRESSITRDEFIAWTNGVWSFSGAKKSHGHPAPFPEELPMRCIKLFSYIGDTVLDPFMGIGTTGVVAQGLKRDFIGYEISQEYYTTCTERIKEEILFYETER